VSVRMLRQPAAGKPKTPSAQDPDPEPAPEPPTIAAALQAPRTMDDMPVVPEGRSLIDDMAGGANAIDGPGLIGYWYTYSDGTGKTYPREGTRAFPSIKHNGKLAREFSGKGQTDWGAGFGFGLTRSDAKRARADAVTTPFDASAYSGVRFDATVVRTERVVEVTFSDADTNPLGGVCDPKATADGPNGTAKNSCNSDFATTVTFPADEWKTLTIEFSKLQLPPWVVFPAARQHGFQKDKLYSIHFQVHPAPPKSPIAEYDLFVANIQFL
jgi:hypothetical protein